MTEPLCQKLKAWRDEKLARRTDGTLHIYAQDCWHFPAGIAATRDALEALRDAIDEALRDGWSCLDAFTNDGEGYSTYIAIADEQAEPLLYLPYTNEMAAENHSMGKLMPESIAEAMLAEKEASSD